jgi:hypothetical protein
MNKGYSHMINCPHLRIFKEFWYCWTFFELTAVKWTESTQCYTQQNIYLVSDGELLVYMFFRDRITSEIQTFWDRQQVHQNIWELFSNCGICSQKILISSSTTMRTSYLARITYRYISTVLGFLTGGSHFTRTEWGSIISTWTFCGGPGKRSKTTWS